MDNNNSVNRPQSRLDTAAAMATGAGRAARSLHRVGPIGFLWPFAVLLIVWQAAASILNAPSYILPRPLSVAETLLSLASTPVLWEHLGASLIRVSLGTLAAVVIGIPLGILMGMNTAAANFFSPLVTFFQAIPGLAWTPLAILWLGIGYEAVTFIIMISVVFPIVFNTWMGVRTVSQSLINAALMLGANQMVLVRDVFIPGSLASIVTGFRIGVAYGWRSLVAAEMIAASSGIGFMIFEARQFLRSDTVIVGMIVLGAVWLALDRIFLKPLEANTIERWGLVRNP